MKTARWMLDQMPWQTGRIVVVTGANSGLGYNTAKALAQKGARVIMACRNVQKGKQASLRIMEDGAAVKPEVWQLDLASLDSVKQFSEKFLESKERLDLLINNAGLMAIPYARTEEEFEMQFGVNHLGHFALTARLWPLISRTEESRVVQVSSLAHHWGKIRFEDIHWERGYKKWGAYGMSKLANLLFIYELSARISSEGKRVIAAAAHPGYADTELQAKGSKMKGSRLGANAFTLVNRLVAQPASMGALPSLYAATAMEVKSGDFFGPGGHLRLRGYPVLEKSSVRRVNSETAREMWSLSENLTGIDFPV
jgi:NAD(P)-dependent dehydrogenase (short-subunit alcohol dehydrogenase family)